MNTPSLAIVGPSGAGKTTLVQDFSQTALIQSVKNSQTPISALLQDTSFTQRDREIYEQQLGAKLSEAYRNCFGCSGKTGLHEFVRLARARAWERDQQNPLVGEVITSLLMMESYSGKTDTFQSIADALDTYGIGPRQQSLVAILSLADEQTVRDQLAFLGATKDQFTELVLTHTDGKDIQTLCHELPDFGVPVFDTLDPSFILSDEEYLQKLNHNYPHHPKLLQQSPIVIRGEHEKDKIRSASHNYIKLGLSGAEYAEILQLLIEYVSQADRYYVPIPVRDDTIDQILMCDIPSNVAEQLSEHRGQFLIVEMGLGMDTIKYSFATEADRVKIRFGANKELKNSFNEKYMDPTSPSHSRDLSARREAVSDNILKEEFANLVEIFEKKVQNGPYVLNDDESMILDEMGSYITNHRNIAISEESLRKSQLLIVDYVQKVFEQECDLLGEKTYTSIGEIGHDMELLVTMARYWTGREKILSPEQKSFLHQYDLGKMMIGLWDDLIAMIDNDTSDNPYLQQPPTLDPDDGQYNPTHIQMVMDSPYSQLDDQTKQEFIQHMITQFIQRESQGMTYASKHQNNRKKITQ